MTNPSPRPALRKAADADVHPAAPRPARSPRARSSAAAAVPDSRPAPEPESVTVAPATASPTPLKPAKKRQADPRKPSRAAKRKFSGSTSDHLRVPELPEVTSSQRSALDHLFENEQATTSPAKAGSGVTKKAKKAKVAEPVDLMSGKPVDLGASVPKELRKAARAKAKKVGLDVDTVVTDLLHAWVTDRG